MGLLADAAAVVVFQFEMQLRIRNGKLVVRTYMAYNNKKQYKGIVRKVILIFRTCSVQRQNMRIGTPVHAAVMAASSLRTTNLQRMLAQYTLQGTQDASRQVTWN
jgi:hypothetical protein